MFIQSHGNRLVCPGMCGHFLAYRLFTSLSLWSLFITSLHAVSSNHLVTMDEAAVTLTMISLHEPSHIFNKDNIHLPLLYAYGDSAEPS